jgi:hypothetical protein
MCAICTLRSLHIHRFSRRTTHQPSRSASAGDIASSLQRDEQQIK